MNLHKQILLNLFENHHLSDQKLEYLANYVYANIFNKGSERALEERINELRAHDDTQCLHTELGTLRITDGEIELA